MSHAKLMLSMWWRYSGAVVQVRDGCKRRSKGLEEGAEVAYTVQDT